MPFELRPYPTPTLKPDGSYLQSAWKNSVYPLAAQMGIEIRLPQVSPQPYTRLAFEGLEFAKDQGLGDAYNSAVMRAFFQRSEDIGQPDVLAHVAGEVGLDADAFRDALDRHTYAARVSELLQYAVDDVGVRGVPLFRIGNLWLSGVQSREALEDAIDQQFTSIADPATGAGPDDPMD